MSAELDALMGNLGVKGDTGNITGGAEDPEDPEIYLGDERTTTYSGDRNTPLGDDGRPLPGYKPRGAESSMLPKSKKASELLNDLRRMNPEQYRKLQRDLYDGGFFDGDVEEDDIRWGDQADEDTEKAYARVLKRAVAYGDAGVKKSLPDVLAEGRTFKEKSAGAGSGRDRDPLVVSLTDPDTIRVTVEKLARQVIGRKLSEAERERFVTLYHSLESSSQNSEYNAGPTGGTVTSGPTSATIEAALEKQFPTEAKQVTATEVGQDFFDLLGGLNGGGSQ